MRSWLFMGILFLMVLELYGCSVYRIEEVNEKSNTAYKLEEAIERGDIVFLDKIYNI